MEKPTLQEFLANHPGKGINDYFRAYPTENTPEQEGAEIRYAPPQPKKERTPLDPREKQTLTALVAVGAAALIFILVVHPDYVGRIALTAFISLVVLIASASLLSKLKSPSSGMALLVLFTVILVFSVGGCIRYASMPNCDYVVFNGNENAIEVIFDGKAMTLASRKVFHTQRRRKKVVVTHPVSGAVEKISFEDGLNVIAHGSAYNLHLNEVEYSRLSITGKRASRGSSALNEQVSNGIRSLRGSFITVLPGESPPDKLTQGKGDRPIRVVRLSVAAARSSSGQPD